jgi:hypothetical protein
MSAAPTSAPEPEIPALLRAAAERAGWPAEALLWERQMADAVAALAGSGDAAAARTRFARALALGDAVFPAVDLRRLTAAANLAILDRNPDALAAVREQWTAGEPWLQTLEGGLRARSSTFHLRLYRRDPAGFRGVAAAHLRRLWEEGLARLAAMAEPQAGAEAAFARWQHIAARTRLGDTRKVAAAAGLLIG